MPNDHNNSRESRHASWLQHLPIFGASYSPQNTAFAAFTAFPPPVEETVSRLEWRDDLKGRIPHPGNYLGIYCYERIKYFDGLPTP